MVNARLLTERMLPVVVYISDHGHSIINYEMSHWTELRVFISVRIDRYIRTTNETGFLVRKKSHEWNSSHRNSGLIMPKQVPRFYSSHSPSNHRSSMSSDAAGWS
jgi:hypothetical protein